MQSFNSSISDRAYLRLTEQEFTGLPWDVSHFNLTASVYHAYIVTPVISTSHMSSGIRNLHFAYTCIYMQNNEGAELLLARLISA